eukprot:m.35423 g.35423  ORF g.35423 m.35423 type:complete len:1678 (-) comp8883_c0_seq1:1451-6484(-)
MENEGPLTRARAAKLQPKTRKRRATTEPKGKESKPRARRSDKRKRTDSSPDKSDELPKKRVTSERKERLEKRKSVPAESVSRKRGAAGVPKRASLSAKSSETKASKEREASKKLADEKNPSHSSSGAGGLQGILERLGPSYIPMMGGQRFGKLLADMQSDNEGLQEQALTEVTDMLLMGNEETLPGFRPEHFVSAIEKLLNQEGRPQVALIACQALNNMIEAIPASTAAVAAASQSLCEKLLRIEYIDLAERAQQVLVKLSADQGKHILRAGGLNAVLCHLDFFPINAQRAAVQTVANICKHVQPSSFQTAKDSIPLLVDILNRTDPTLVEPACLGFSRIIGNCSNSPEILNKISENGVVLKLLELNSNESTPTSIKAMTFRSLRTIVAACPDQASPLLENHIPTHIRKMLGNSEPNSQKQVADSGSQLDLSSQDLLEIVRLANVILPDLPKEAFLSDFLDKKSNLLDCKNTWEYQGDDGCWRAYTDVANRQIERAFAARDRSCQLTINGAPYTLNFAEMLQINRLSRNGRAIRQIPRVKGVNLYGKDPRAILLEAQPNYLAEYCEALLAPLFDVFLSSASSAVDHECLHAIVKILFAACPDMLQTYLKTIGVSSYLVGMLKSADVIVVAAALQIFDLLNEKLPDIFKSFFRRHGVLHEVLVISTAEDKTQTDVEVDIESKSADPLQQLSALFEDEHIAQKQNVGNQENLELEISVKHFATASIKKHFDFKSNKDQIENHPDFELLRKCKALSKSLTETVHQGEEVTHLLEEIAKVLSDEDLSVTPFEVLQSNLIPAILSCFSTSSVSEGTHSRMDRISGFSNIFFDNELVLSKMISMLHGVLNLVENFKVVESQESRGEALGALSRPMKLELARDASSSNLKELPTSVVLIEPLASIQAIEDFLWPRVKMTKTELKQKQRENSDCWEFKDNGKRNAAWLELSSIKCEENKFLKSVKNGSKTDLNIGADSYTFDPSKLVALNKATGKELLFRKRTNAQRNAPQYSEANEEELSEIGEEDSDEEEENGSRQQRRRRNETMDLNLPEKGPDCFLIPPVFGRSKSTAQRRLTMLCNGRPIASSLTIFQAVQRDARGGLPEMRTHSTTHRLTYREYRTGDHAKSGIYASNAGGLHHAGGNAYDALQDPTLTQSVFSADEPSKDVFLLFRCLHAVNSYRSKLKEKSGCVVLSNKHFVNNKLASKIARQVSDFHSICSFTFPPWFHKVIAQTPFIVPVETRRLYFYYTAFGPARALQRYQQLHQDFTTDVGHEQQSNNTRLSRIKVKIGRERILESAYHLLYSFASSKCILELEFRGEVGTGLGPTLEFFALTSRAFQERQLDIWRSDSFVSGLDMENNEIEYVYSESGLFPKPINPAAEASSKETKKKKILFETFGRLLARAIMDGRLLDIPLSPLFYTALLNRNTDLSVQGLAQIDPALANTLQKFEDLDIRREAITRDSSLTKEQKSEKINAITMDGMKLEDSGFVFTLPGYDDINLKPNGSEIPVTIHNCKEFVERVVHVTLVESVGMQMDAVKAGFNSVFPVENLSLFTSFEIGKLACGEQNEAWSEEELASSIKADHGFNAKSKTVTWLIGCLTKFSSSERRIFLQFVTGSPNMSVGGLQALNPPLTVVRKGSSDNELPSVMTCQNYLKLPEYSSAEVLKAQLTKAMTEGRGSFLLS